MNHPDFSRYDKAQLLQVRGRIDAHRFPDRVAQIDARLLELANAPPQPPAAVQTCADRSTYLPLMRRAGWWWLGIGVLDLGFGLWSTSAQAGVTGVNLGCIVVGALLMSGSLRVAIVLRWLMWTSAVGSVLAVPLMLSQPLDLTLTQLRWTTAPFVGSVLLALAQSCLLIYSLRMLGDSTIETARDVERRRRYDMRIPFALGAVLSIAMTVFLHGQAWGERGRHAEQLALAQGGAAYRYHVRSINIMFGSDGTFVTANVVAWNDGNIGNVAVRWKE